MRTRRIVMDPGMPTFALALRALGGIAALAILAVAMRRAPWSRFAASEPTHVFLGSLLFVMLLWSIRATFPGVPPLHLLGIGALCLCAGPALALVGGAVIVVVTSLLHDAPLSRAGLAFVAQVAVPVAVQYGALVASRRVLPRNPFAYFFAVAFAGGAASFFAAAVTGRVVALADAGVVGAITVGEFAILALLLSFGEATLTGMLLTLAVVYRPAWVATFDDAQYLAKR
jgi:uncharacterized membrane protein